MNRIIEQRVCLELQKTEYKQNYRPQSMNRIIEDDRVEIE